jgi:hypothetical protein
MHDEFMAQSMVVSCLLLLVALICFTCTLQKISYIVRDSLINVGPLKDFSYGLRANADPNATGNAKQSNYELVSSWYFTSVFC